MAQAQKEKPAESPAMQQQLDFISRLNPDNVNSWGFPTRVPGAAGLTTNAVKINEVIDLVSKGRPPEEEVEKRRNYDEALKVIGKAAPNDLDSKAAQKATMDTLIEMHLDALTRLSTQVVEDKVKDRSDFGDDADALQKDLKAAQELASNPGRYHAYYGKDDIFEPLLYKLAGASPQEVKVRETDITGESSPPEMVQRPRETTTSVQLVETSGEGFTMVSRPTVIPESAKSMCGGEEAAADYHVQVATGIQATQSPSATELEKRQLATNIYESSKSMFQGKKEFWKQDEDLPDPSLAPDLYQGMKDLKEGRLRSGIAGLRRDPAFGDFFKNVDTIYVLKVRQRAIESYKAGLTLNFVLPEGRAQLNSYISKAKGRLSPVLLSMAVGFHKAHIITGANLEQHLVTEKSDDIIGTKKVTGHGDIWGVSPQLTLAGGIDWGSQAQGPVLITIFSEMGTRKYTTGAELTDAAGKRTGETLKATQGGFYLGFTGVEIGWPGVEGRKNVPRLERLTLAVEPSGADVKTIGSKPADFMGEIEFSGNWSNENPTTKWRTRFSPLLNYFLGQVIVGGVLTPVDVTHKLSEYFTIYGGPPVRYEYNTGDKSHTVEFGGRVGVKYSKGIAVEFGGGYTIGWNASPEQTLPTDKGQPGMSAVMLNVIWTPEETIWGKPSKASEKIYKKVK